MADALPRPVFVDTDAKALTAELKAFYEGLSGTPLRPTQPEMLMIHVIAYAANLVRIAIQLTGEALLLLYARWPVIDHLGALFRIERKEAASARTTLRFTLAAPPVVGKLIARGVRVRSADGVATFATIEDLTIAAGETEGEVIAEAKIAGTLGNGYEAGEVNVLLDADPEVASVENVTASAGGAGREDDDRVRDQIRRAPDGFSTAGPKPAYEFFARRAHPEIVDVAALSEEDGIAPGLIRLYPLMADGLPSVELQALVAAVFDGPQDVAPTCDRIAVLPPPEVGFDLVVNVTLLRDADAATTTAAVQEAADAYAEYLRGGLGRDVVREDVAARLKLPGVYKPEVASPPADIVVARHEWTNPTSVQINIVGNAEG